MKVLIVDDSPIALTYYKTLAEKENCFVITATNGEEGYILFEKEKPDITITDIEMPKVNGLELLKKIRNKDENAIVIITTAIDNESYVIEALKNKANNYIKKTYNDNEFLQILREYKDILNAEKYDKEWHLNLDKIEYEYVFDNNIHNISKYINYLLNPIKEFFTNDEIIDIKIGLGELLINAIEHGNMGLSYEEKKRILESDEKTIIDFFNSKLNDPLINKRKVIAKFVMEKRYFEWIIQDDGEGFDWKKLLSSGVLNDPARLNGRGFVLCSISFNEIEFLGNGNTVRVRKYRN